MFLAELIVLAAARSPPPNVRRGKISFDNLVNSLPSPRSQEVKWIVALGYACLVVVALLAMCRPIKKPPKAEEKEQ